MKGRNNAGFKLKLGAVLALLLAGGLAGQGWAVIISVSTPSVADTALDSYYTSGAAIGIPGYFGTNAIGIVAGASAAIEIDRDLLRFDVSSIPTNAHVLSATLRVAFSGSNPAMATTLSLYRVNAPWTEVGASWLTRDGVNAWSAPGTASGTDYVATPSSSLNSMFQGSTFSRVDFSFTGLAADVQAWVNNPAGNNGWILINSDEVHYRDVYPYPDKQWWTREWSIANGQTFDAMPFLDIQFEVVPEPGMVSLFTLGFGFCWWRRQR